MLNKFINLEAISNSKSWQVLKKVHYFSTTWTGAIIIVMLIISFVAQSFIIPSGSMIGTLLIGDMLLVKKYTYGTPTPHVPWLEVPMIPSAGLKLFDGEKPKRGDIVVFRKPGEERTHFVKRCVAVSGDLIMQKDKDLYIRPHEGNEFITANFHAEDIVSMEGTLWVKNPYERDHRGIQHDNSIINDGSQPHQIFNFAPKRIAENEYFMMGDNRDHSNDSRFWGSVPYENIEGSPWLIYLSFDENKSIRWNRMFKNIDEIEESLKK